MKRTLSLVLALVMVLGSFSAVFAAEANVENEAGALLKKLGVLVGDASGDLMLEDGLKRQDAVILLSKLMGEFDEAAATKGSPTFKDIKDNFYLPFLAWAQANGTFVGHSDAKFGFDDNLTTQEYASVLLRVLGYEVEWTETLVKAKELGLLANVEADATFVRGTMAVMTLNALGTKMNGSEKTLAEELEIEMPAPAKLEVKEVKVSGAKTFLVTFNKAVEDTSKFAFTAKRGGTEIKVTAKWNEAKTEVTLESASNFPIGDYTVVVTDKTESEAKEMAKYELKIEREKIAEVVFNSDIINRIDDVEGIVGYKVVNQYGEDVTNSGLARNIKWVSSTNQPVKEDFSSGTLTISHGTTSTPGNQLVNLKNVVITGTDYTTGFSVTKTFEVSLLRGSIGEVKINGIVDKDGKAVDFLADQSQAYYLDVEVYDMSGNRITSNKILGNSSIFEVISSNSGIVNILPEEKDGVTKFRLQTIGIQNYDMPVVFTAISKYTGKTATYNVTLAKSRKVEKFVLHYPSTEVTEYETVEIPFEAYDQNGNKMTRYSELVGKMNYSMAVIEKQDSNGNYRIFVTAGAANSMLILTATVKDSTTGSFSQLSLSVREGNEPVKLNNIVFTDALQKGATLTVGFDDDITPEIKDKYNKDMSLYYREEYAGSRYYVKAESLNPSVISVADPTQELSLTNNVGITANNAGVGTINLTLYKHDGTTETKLDTKSVTMIVVEDKDIVDVKVSAIKSDIYNINKLGALKGTTIDGQYGTGVLVKGLLANGGTVILKDNQVTQIVANNPNYTVGSVANLGSSGMYASVKSDIGTATTAKSSVTAYVYSSYGTLLSGSTEINTISDIPVNSKITVKYEYDALRYRKVDTTLNDILVNSAIDEITLKSSDINLKSIFEFATDGTKTAAANKAPFWFRVSNQYGNGGLVKDVRVIPHGTVSGSFIVNPVTGVVTASGTGTYLITVSTNNGLTKTVTVTLK